MKIVTFCILLLIAGNETTTNLLGNFMALPVGHVGLDKRLRREPNLIPAAIEETTRYDGPVQIAIVTLGPSFEGAPGRAHGGIVAAVFDDVTGNVLRLAGSPAFTARLTISYPAPTPLEVPLEFRSRLEAREPRKLHIAADCRHDGQLNCVGRRALCHR